MKWFLFFLFMFAPVSRAQIETTRTVAEAINVSKVEEAKPYLIHSAVLDAIKDYSTELGLDAQAFRSNLNQKFDEHFESYKTRKFTEKFGKDFATKLSEEEKKNFLEEIEKNKSQQFISYARLEQLLDSYAFQTVGNDSSHPSEWKAEVVLNLNRSRLEKLNQRLMSKEPRQYSKLQIVSEINLIGMNWQDLRLENNRSFTDPLTSSWFKWLSTNQPGTVDEVVQCSGECIQSFSRWLDIPQEEGMQVPEDILNSVWLKVSFNLRKVSFLENINEWKFEWEGSVVLIDANTKLILSSHTIYPEKKTWRALDQKALNSALVTAIYRSALDPLSKVTTKLENSFRLNRLSRLVIRGHEHLGDVFSLMELLKKEGNKLHLNLSIDFFTQKEAYLLCFYQGEEKSFTDLLSRVKELKSSHSYSVVNEYTGIHHVLRLIAE